MENKGLRGECRCVVSEVGWATEIGILLLKKFAAAAPSFAPKPPEKPEKDTPFHLHHSQRAVLVRAPFVYTFFKSLF